jgi:hypothetical protein
MHARRERESGHSLRTGAKEDAAERQITCGTAEKMLCGGVIV